MQIQGAANSLAVTAYKATSTNNANQPALPPTGILAGQQSPDAQPLQSTPPERRVQESTAATPADDKNNLPQNEARNSKSADSESLHSEKDLTEIRELVTRDREVRQHELSHAAAGGKYAGAPSFEFERGPDGRLYAVGGEVSIDTSPVLNDPKATLEKAEVILRAALSVAEPSAQDRAVAARASVMAAEARAELAKQEQPDGSGIEDQQLNDARRSEELKKAAEEKQEHKEKLGESLDDFNERLQDVNTRFTEINQRLIDVGVFKKLFPEGLIFDQIV